MAECPVVYGYIRRDRTAAEETPDLVTILIETGAEETIIDIARR